jgi:hypothetical protein
LIIDAITEAGSPPFPELTTDDRRLIGTLGQTPMLATGEELNILTTPASGKAEF